MIPTTSHIRRRPSGGSADAFSVLDLEEDGDRSDDNDGTFTMSSGETPLFVNATTRSSKTIAKKSYAKSSRNPTRMPRRYRNEEDFHNSKDLKAEAAPPRPMKRRPSFGFLDRDYFLVEAYEASQQRNKRIGLAVAALALSCLGLFYSGIRPSDYTPTSRSSKKQMDTYYHHISQSAIPKKHAAKYLQKSEIEHGAKPKSNGKTLSEQYKEIKKQIARRNADNPKKVAVLNSNQQDFLDQHNAMLQDASNVLAVAADARIVPPNAQIHFADLSTSQLSLNEINANFQYLAPTAEPLRNDGTEIPLFWEISGGDAGQIVRNVLVCRGAVLASNEGIVDGNGDLPDLRVVDLDSGRFVNVDTTTHEGMERAKNLGLASSDLVDVIITPLFQQVMALFDASNHRARAFTQLRHPVERSLNTFLMLQANNDPAVENMSLEQYAESSLLEDNWMVRTLSGNLDRKLLPEDLNVAKEILTSRFIVGMHEDRYGSVARFEKYFGWQYVAHQNDCRQDAFQQEDHRPDVAKQMIADRKEVLPLLWAQNEMDIQLYDFADALYRHDAFNFV